MKKTVFILAIAAASFSCSWGDASASEQALKANTLSPLSCAPLQHVGKLVIFRTESSVYVGKQDGERVLQVFSDPPYPCDSKLDFDAHVFVRGIYAEVSTGKANNPFASGDQEEVLSALEKKFATAEEDSFLLTSDWKTIKNAKFEKPLSLSTIIAAFDPADTDSVAAQAHPSEATAPEIKNKSETIATENKGLEKSPSEKIEANNTLEQTPALPPIPVQAAAPVKEVDITTPGAPLPPPPPTSKAPGDSALLTPAPTTQLPPSVDPAVVIENAKRAEYQKLWDDRNQIILKNGDLVCAYKSNEFGVLKRQLNGTVYLLILGQVANAEEGFLFNNAALDPNFEYEMLYLDDIALPREDVSLCPFRL